MEKASQIYATSSPSEVWILGDAWMLDELVVAGIPSARVKVDDTTANTRDQMAWVKRREASDPGQPFRHHRFALAGAEDRGPGSGGWQSRRQSSRRRSTTSRRRRESVIYVPRYIALRVSRDAIYELVALKYYRRQGWIQ